MLLEGNTGECTSCVCLCLCVCEDELFSSMRTCIDHFGAVGVMESKQVSSFVCLSVSLFACVLSSMYGFCELAGVHRVALRAPHTASVFSLTLYLQHFV